MTKIAYIVDAVQWTGENSDEVCNFLGDPPRLEEYEPGTWFWENWNSGKTFSNSDPDEGVVRVINQEFQRCGNCLSNIEGSCPGDASNFCNCWIGGDL